jgi:hypothetical protein
MLRNLAVVAIGFAALSPPAEAAIAVKMEKGVRVWRAPVAVAAPTLKRDSGACPHMEIAIIKDFGAPARRLRIHGFSAGDGFGLEQRLPLTTQGFYADRIAAGL